jgi:hypothetical protein
MRKGIIVLAAAGAMTFAGCGANGNVADSGGNNYDPNAAYQRGVSECQEMKAAEHKSQSDAEAVIQGETTDQAMNDVLAGCDSVYGS